MQFTPLAPALSHTALLSLHPKHTQQAQLQELFTKYKLDLLTVAKEIRITYTSMTAIVQEVLNGTAGAFLESTAP